MNRDFEFEDTGARKGTPRFMWRCETTDPDDWHGPFKTMKEAWADVDAWVKNDRRVHYDGGTLKDKSRYLLETPPRVPDGKVICHNRVLPAEPLGLHGFRAWTMPYDPNALRRCHCGWAPHLKHYAWRGLEHKHPTKVRTYLTDIHGNKEG
jgi:hypothetical protein